MNEMSSSRGEANFVWKRKNCKVRTSQALGCMCVLWKSRSRLRQRESTATIKAAPTAYKVMDPPKRQDILEFDCRGLEFLEFKPEVRVRPANRPEQSVRPNAHT